MTLTYYLVLAAILFTIGAVGVLVRRNAIVVFMCIELMLNSVNLTLVTFARQRDRAEDPEGDRLPRADDDVVHACSPTTASDGDPGCGTRR